MSEGTHGWRSRLDTALTVAALAASLLAIAVLITLAWWLRSLSTTPPPEIAVQSVPVPAPRQAAAVPRSVPAPPRPAAPPLQQAAAAVAAPPTGGPTTAPPTPRQNDDAAKNRALGAALSRLGNDPELRRKLGIDVPP